MRISEGVFGLNVKCILETSEYKVGAVTETQLPAADHLHSRGVLLAVWGE